MPHIACTRLDVYTPAPDAVVVIDVIRAFTTAAFAFAAGARDILLVAGVEEALALRLKHPGSVVMGEVGGLPPPGFDFGNSPVAISQADLRGKRLIQRTGSGTQGARPLPRGVAAIGCKLRMRSRDAYASARCRTPRCHHGGHRP